MILFTLLLTATAFMFMLFSIMTYGNMSKKLSHIYMSDITYQTTNNLSSLIREIEDTHIQILSSSIVQEQLNFTNKNHMTEYLVRNVDQIIERELATSVLLNEQISSANVVSKSGINYSITNIDGTPFECAFSEEEIYDANGTTLWKLIGENNNICTAKAILDFKTMMPLGYINLVFKQEYFSAIVQNHSTEFSGITYAVDKNRQIVSSNKFELISREFPFAIEEIEGNQKVSYDLLNQEHVYYFVGDEMMNGWMLVQSVSVKELHKGIYRNLCITLFFLCLILVIGFLMTKLATQYIIRPTKELVESMKLFGKGNLSHRVEIQTADEIGQIGAEYNHMAENIEILIEKVLKMEILQKQAEIDFLCMQINPHFLYNTLDTISWMAIGEKNTDISEMTIALADLLRAMVKSERFVTIEEELRTVKDYLYIQRQRFGERISVEYQIDPSVYVYQMPNFILQPLIENAIIHGLENRVENGVLRLIIEKKQELLFFMIEDNGVGMTEDEIENLYMACESEDTKQSIGLKNVYRRLILCYGETSRISINSRKGFGTEIKFCIPLKQKNN